MESALPRHERLDDLLALSEDPSPHKTRRVEWIGQKSPLEDPRVQLNLLMGNYTPLQETAIRLAAARAVTRVGNVRSRLIEHDHRYGMATFKGLSRSYHFTPLNSFICELTYRDADILLSSECGKEFRDLDDPNSRDQVKVLDSEVFKLIAVDVMDRDTTPLPRRMLVGSH